MGKIPGKTQRWGKPLGQFASIAIISIETRVDWQRSQRSVIKPGKHKCVSVALQDSLLECSAAIFHSALEPCSCRSALLSSQGFPSHFKSSILPLPSVVFPLPIDQSSFLFPSRHYLTRCSRPFSEVVQIQHCSQFSLQRFIGGSGPPRSVCGRFRSPPQGNAGDERVAEVGQPPLPASTGGTLCLSNGPLQTSRVKLY